MFCFENNLKKERENADKGGGEITEIYCNSTYYLTLKIL